MDRGRFATVEKEENEPQIDSDEQRSEQSLKWLIPCFVCDDHLYSSWPLSLVETKLA
jgi:hypothetical protein